MEDFITELSWFFKWLVTSSIQVSVLVCLILVIKAVVRGRLAVRWHYWLWLLLLARMVMPWAPESRFSMFSVVPQATKVIAAKQIAKVTPIPSTVVVKPKVTQGVTPKATKIQENQEPVESISTAPQSTQISTSTGQLSFELIDILSLSWFIVALGFATFALGCNFRLWRIIKSQRPLTEGKILDLLEDCKTKMGIQTILGVIVSDRVKSPALFGVVRPRLLLPEGMTEMLSREELRYVFLHELAHLKRRNIYLGWFMVVLQILHWFNPLVWLAFAQMRADRELACDSLVLSTMGVNESQGYGRTIVNLFKGFSQIQYVPGIAGILENKSQLKRRIIMIAQFKKGTYGWSILAIILLAVLGSVALTNGRTIKGDSSALVKIMPEDLYKNLVLYYSFDKDGGTKAVDISGMDFHGKVHGASWIEEGVSGGAMSFDGEDDYIGIGEMSLKAFTLSAWLKVLVPERPVITENFKGFREEGLALPEKSGYGKIDNRRLFLLDDVKHFYKVELNNKGGLGFSASDRTGIQREDIGVHEYDWSFAGGQWTHVVVSYDGKGKVDIYKNGKLTETGKDTFIKELTGTAYIGGTSKYRGEFWHGMLDEVALFNRALSDTEVKQLYNVVSSRIAPGEGTSIDPLTLRLRTEDSCYFAEDFESHNEGSLPGQWIVVYNGQGNKAQGIRAESGNKYLRVAGRRGWSCVLRHEFTQPMPSKVYFSFRVRTLSGIGVFGIGNGTKCAAYAIEDLEIRDDRWHNILFIVDFDGGVSSIFVDNKPAHQGVPLSIQDPKARWTYWGNRPAIAFDSDNKVQGEIQVDDIKIDDLRYTLNGSIEPTGLVGHWSFDNDDGDTVIDSSPYANHGKLKTAANETAITKWASQKNVSKLLNEADSFVTQMAQAKEREDWRSVDVGAQKLWYILRKLKTTMPRGTPGRALESTMPGGTSGRALESIIRISPEAPQHYREGVPELSDCISRLDELCDDLHSSIRDKKMSVVSEIYQEFNKQWTHFSSITQFKPGAGKTGPTLVDGILGKAYYFDGVDDYVEIGDVDEFEFGDNDFSIAAWFYTEGSYVEGTRAIITKYNYSDLGRQWKLVENTTGYVYLYTSPDGRAGETLLTQSDGYQNQWVHVVGVRTGSTKLLYIDGVLDNTGSTAGVVTGKSSKVYIGCWDSPGGIGRFFNGKIDDVRIYNRALNTEEIRQLYNLTNLEEQDSTKIQPSKQKPTGPQWVLYQRPNAGANYALKFDGLDDFVQVPRSQSLEPTEEITVELWAFLDGRQNRNARLVRKAGDMAPGYLLAADQTGDRTMQFRIDRGRGNITRAADKQTNLAYAGQWHHFAGVYSRTHAHFYIDGIEVRKIRHDEGKIYHSSVDLYIGHGAPGPNEHFKGAIDEVRIWSIARSQLDIQEDMYRTLNGSESGLVGYWKFDEGKGDTVQDSSGNGNHGKLGQTQRRTPRTRPKTVPDLSHITSTIETPLNTGLVGYWNFDGNAKEN